MPEKYDITVIGGGINGTGIAADAAGRGLSVYLCEQYDLASATSSASSKLIHGGLRYLEQLQFRLVKEALTEREILLRKAPHLIQPLRFILPHNKALRSELVIRLGLFLYDHLAKHMLLPDSQVIHFSRDVACQIIKSNYPKGFAYSDGFVDDSRLVVANALAAQKSDALIETRTRCTNAIRKKSHWEIELYDSVKNLTKKIQSKSLINASGPWALDFLNKIKIKSDYKISLVKGSHIVLPKFYPGDHAYILQNHDKRVIFVIPYLNDFCLIGTTDLFFSGDPMTAKIEEEEIIYLCRAISSYFSVTLNPSDIVHTYSGVRALPDTTNTKAAALSRDYILELNTEGAPLLSVLGGKITTYRKLAEKAVNLLSAYFPNSKPSFTENCVLPGGDLNMSLSQYIATQKQKYPYLPQVLLQRFIHQYGTLTDVLLQDVHSFSDLGKHYGAQLYQKEVEYLVKNEWVFNSEDILWRRTKLGYFFPLKYISDLEQDLKAMFFLRVNR